MSEVPMKPQTVTECKPVTKWVVDEDAFDMQPSISKEELEALGQTDLDSLVIEQGFRAWTPPGYVVGGATVVPSPPPMSEVPLPAASWFFISGAVGLALAVK